MNLIKGLIRKYFDYDIVGSYLAYEHGKYVTRYIKKYKLRKRG